MAKKAIANTVFNLGKLEMPDILSLAPEIRKKVLREGAKVIALEARRIAPDSGQRHKNKLNKTITYRARSGGTEMAVVVKAPHAHLVHDGTRPHIITPSSPEAAKRGWRFYPGGRPVHHPGARAQPFLTDAGENKRPEVEQIMREKAVEVLAEIASKS